MENMINTTISEFDQRLEQLITDTESVISGWSNIDISKLEKSESSLDAWDYCFSIAIGLGASFISTNDELQDYLIEIHHAASEATGEYDFLQAFLGKLLHHKGDPIDKVNQNFTKRDNEKAWILFHRLLWGHDILSIKPDNPFYLMIKKQGLSGIIQAIQHLLADTTSKQGLPFPGSSFLDFHDKDGKLSNYLISISQHLSLESTGNKQLAQEIYSHMFTIRAADLIGQSSVSVLSNIYLMVRKIDDRIRILQIRFIACAVHFWMQAILGYVKYKIPYVNIPAGKEMIQSFVVLYSENRSRIQALLKKEIVRSSDINHLIAIAESDFSSCESSGNNISAEERIRRGQENVIKLMHMWEEDFNADNS